MSNRYFLVYVLFVVGLLPVLLEEDFLGLFMLEGHLGLWLGGVLIVWVGLHFVVLQIFEGDVE